MFNVGPGELIAILALALIVLGPNRLPEAVRTVGRVVGELRRISSGFQDELRNALEDSEVENDLEKLRSSNKADSPDKSAELTSVPGDGAEPIDVDVIDDDGKDPSIDDDVEADDEVSEPVVPEPEPVDDEPPADGERAAS
jgi:sec-independent protein translocase protein TatB